jgi:hypothetical protein
VLQICAILQYQTTPNELEIANARRESRPIAHVGLVRKDHLVGRRQDYPRSRSNALQCRLQYSVQTHISPCCPPFFWVKCVWVRDPLLVDSSTASDSQRLNEKVLLVSPLLIARAPHHPARQGTACWFSFHEARVGLPEVDRARHVVFLLYRAVVKANASRPPTSQLRDGDFTSTTHTIPAADCRCPN